MKDQEQKIPDGGSAFPSEQHECADGTWNQTFEPGMSLRDFFAAKALPILAETWRDTAYPADNEVVAQKAYRIADAMLAERAKATSPEAQQS